MFLPVPRTSSISNCNRIRVIFRLLAVLLCIPGLLISQVFQPGFRSYDACDFCLASQGISPLEVGSSGMRIDVRYLSVSTLYQDGSKTVNADRELETHLTQQYTFFLALSDGLSFSSLVPIPRQHSERVTDQGTMVVGNQFGIGDIALLARFKPIVAHDVESTYILSLQGGVKLPTGTTNGTDSQGQLLDAHVQLGTGSTDFIVGASGFAAGNRFALIVNVLGSLTGKGSNGHEFGDLLNYDVTVRYRLSPEDYDPPQFFATLGINGEIRGHEIQDGATDPNSGGNVVYLSPGIQMFVSSSLTIEFSYQQPILHNLYGQQLGEDYRLMSGIQVLF